MILHSGCVISKCKVNGFVYSFLCMGVENVKFMQVVVDDECFWIGYNLFNL